MVEGLASLQGPRSSCGALSLRRHWHLAQGPALVAGLPRAVPSTALDERRPLDCWPIF